MAVSSGLSSTLIHKQLKEGKYGECLKSADQHFLSNPGDFTSASKLINALSYHVYYTQTIFKDTASMPGGDLDLAQLYQTWSTAWSILGDHGAAKLASSDPESRSKLLTSGHILAKSALVRSSRHWGSFPSIGDPFKRFLEKLLSECGPVVGVKKSGDNSSAADDGEDSSSSGKTKKKTTNNVDRVLADSLSSHVDCLEAMAGFAAVFRECMKVKPTTERDLRTLLTDNRLNHSDPAYKTFACHLYHLDGLLLLAKSGSESGLSDNAQTVIKSLMKVAKILDRKKDVALFASTFECLIIVSARIGVFYKSRKFSLSQHFLEFSRENYLWLSKLIPPKHYIPNVKILNICHHLYELYDHYSEKDEKTEDYNKRIPEVLNLSLEIVAKIKAAGKKESFLLEVFHIQTLFQIFTVGYSELKSRVSAEVARNAKVAAEAEKAELEAQSKARGNDNTATEAEREKKVGDVNPYINGLTLESEVALHAQILDMVQRVETTLATHGEGSLSLVGSYIAPSTLVKMILAMGEFSGLLGHPDLQRRALESALKASSKLQIPEFECIALSEIIMLEQDVPQAHSDKFTELLNGKEGQANTFSAYRIPVAIAWSMWHQGQVQESLELAGRIWTALDTMRPETQFRIVKASLLLLITVARLAPGSVVQCPASPTSTLPKIILENGPMELSLDTFIESTTAMNSSAKYGLSVLFRAGALQWKVLKTRTDLCDWTGLAKELRLYGKLGMECCQGMALTVRTASCLLRMAEIDLQCDDPDQCQVKLDGIHTILGRDILGSSCESSSVLGTKATKSKHLEDPMCASPQLQRHSPFSRPPFLSHEAGNCDCYQCAQTLFLGIVITYFNHQGVCYHMRGDHEAAASHFEGVLGIISAVEVRIRGIRDPGQRFDTQLEVLNALYWQVECYGRDDYLSKCEEILEQQKRLLQTMPKAKMTAMPVILNRYYEQGLFVKRAERLNVSGITQGFRTALSLTPRPLKDANASATVTPIVRPKRTRPAPKKPVKKVI